MSRPEGFFLKHEPVLVNLLNAVDVAGHTTVAVTQYQERPVIALIGAAFAFINTYAIGLQTHELRRNNQVLAEALKKEVSEKTAIVPYRGTFKKS